MSSDDADRRDLVMLHVDECRNRADEALRKNRPAAVKAWFDSMAAALMVDHLLQQRLDTDLYDTLQQVLPTLFLPLHYETSWDEEDDRDHTQLIAFGGQTFRYHGSHHRLVRSVRRGERIALQNVSLGREDALEPSLVYIAPGWLPPLFEENPVGDEPE